MVSPRTPLRIQRYGPSSVGDTGKEGGAVGGGIFGGGRNVVRRKPVPGTGSVGLGIDGAKSSFSVLQNNGRVGEDEDVLVRRAQEAILLAEQRGDGMVEMEEAEWEAWQRHEAIEREVERRLAERLAERERERERLSRKVVVPTAAISPALRTSRPSAPGFLLPGDDFQPLGESPKPSPRLGVAQLSPASSKPVGTRHTYPEAPITRHRNRNSVDLTPPLSPAQQILSGAFPEDDELLAPPARSPLARTTNSQSATSLSMLDRHGMVASPAKRASRQPDSSSQPGASYYPGLHPSLAARSETDISRLELDDDNEGSVLSSSSQSSSRRAKRRF